MTIPCKLSVAVLNWRGVMVSAGVAGYAEYWTEYKQTTAKIQQAYKR